MKKFTVTGMTCAACSARVEKAVSAVDGVTACNVNLLTNSMGVEGTATDAAVIAAVQNAGYGAFLPSDAPDAAPKPASLDDRREQNALKRRFIASLLFLLPLMYLTMGGMAGLPLPAFSPLSLGLTQLLLSAAVMVVNQAVFIRGIQGVRHLAPNMDTLVSLGSSAAFVYSTATVYRMTAGHAAMMHDLYFESAAMILTLITLGKMLEARSKGRTTDALKGLMRLAPQTATVRRGGEDITVPVTAVRVGDLFVVRPGESIPVDGVIREGGGAVDEAALTGESIPQDKTVGDAVSAATVNRDGFLVCEATRVGEDTTHAQIIRMVSDAAATKAPIAKAADTVAGVFVPVVLAIAVITVVVWLLVGQTAGFALSRGIAVLVISCPCALGLATPVAIMVGNGAGAKHGILFKTATALEITGRVKTVVMDKTGTLTEGHPALTDCVPTEGISEDELLGIAYALERQSEHPLAHAVVDAAEAKGLSAQPVTDFEAVAGHGLSANLNDSRICGGNATFVRELAVIDTVWEKRAATLASEGKTPLYFAKDGQLLGILAVADPLREDSTRAVQEMHKMGLHTVMLTGDTARTAHAVAAAAGVDEVIAEVLPDEKEAVVRRLQENGRVAMVGDGINDAPALTRADVGIAVGAGTDIAIDAADVVLMHNRLSDAVGAIKLSRATLRIIRQNLFWAFLYNTIGIPLAAGVFIPLFGWELNPMFGAAAMSLSSFCVVSNALRLNRFRLPRVGDGVTVHIQGMMCHHCEAHVREALENLSGVTVLTVSHESGTATITGDIDETAVKAAVQAAGYKVKKIQQ
ncbi:MAG: heavy metal translocating P-type ATPase [Ruminococcaceae bacterium]|nr:heavy metal translocating P-type ATPase [Oscillospiraceae bacterium]